MGFSFSTIVEFSKNCIVDFIILFSMKLANWNFHFSGRKYEVHNKYNTCNDCDHTQCNSCLKYIKF